jgi:hypothetical protein
MNPGLPALESLRGDYLGIQIHLNLNHFENLQNSIQQFPDSTFVVLLAAVCLYQNPDPVLLSAVGMQSSLLPQKEESSLKLYG